MRPGAKWLADLPLIKQLRQSVGVQRFMLVAGLTITLAYIVIAIFAPLIAPYGFAQLRDASGASFPTHAAPSAAHPWGTTLIGYDVFSRVIWGTRTALTVIVVAVVISVVVGVLIGLISGYFGGWLDRVLVVIADAIYAFPSLLLAILVAIMLSHGASAFWRGILAAAISISVVYVPQYFRVVRAEVVRVKAEAFVESARVIGAPTARILFLHVLRNCLRTLPLILTLNAVDSFETLAGLGFLGLGIEPTAAAEWGYDLQKAVPDVTSGIWWTAIYPGIAIVLLAVGVSILGEGLNDLSDPRLRAQPTGEGGEVSDEFAVRIDRLNVTFATDGGDVRAVRDVSLEVRRGEVLAIVGESGSGKTVTARAILGLLAETAMATGAVFVGDENVLAVPKDELRRLRGTKAAMVFQEPSTALNPVFTVGWQIAEGLRAHRRISRSAARAAAVDILRKVGIPDPETSVGKYPHEFSGGQKQRVVIACALALDPRGHRRRRADDGARCHRAGRDPRPAASGAGRVRHRDRPHHAQHGRRRRSRRPRRGDA